MKITQNLPAWFFEKRNLASLAYGKLEISNIFFDIDLTDDLQNYPLSISNLSLNTNNEPAISNEDFFFTNPPKEELKKQGIIIESLDKAILIHPNLIKNTLYTQSFDESKFEAMNSAFWQRGIFIHIPEGIHLDVPIKFGFLTGNSNENIIDNTLTYSTILDRILIIASKNSKVTFLQSTPKNFTPSNNSKKIFRCEVIELIANENAEVFYGNIQSFSSNVKNLSIKKASVKKHSFLNWMDCCFGGDLTVSQIFTNLEEMGAKTNNWGVFFGKEEQRFGIFLKNQHTHSNTTSDMLTKGVLDEKAKSFYNGTVKIVEKATGSNGYQKQDVLLLSAKAGADAKPNLEIDNNGVRCTHGVSIGQVDKEKLFYMMSRGLTEEQAKSKIVEGFFDTILRKIPLSSLKEEVESLVLENLYSTQKTNGERNVN